ncbi:hypothetical protein [Deinococcus aquaticus]|uniref:hypothetical protein n=1 Tax=Deinococcus aquaticus TaxID=328692 RepID=UPI003F467CAE
MLDTLALARDILLALPGVPPVLMRGQPDPGGDQVIVLDRVADTGAGGYGRAATTKLIQVTCYAPSVQRALELTAQTRSALAGAGFSFVASRPAPDGSGELSEYRR